MNLVGFETQTKPSTLYLKKKEIPFKLELISPSNILIIYYLSKYDYKHKYSTMQDSNSSIEWKWC